MRRLAIEINDAELIAADDSGVVWSAPGCATVERGRILTGADSYERARLAPRDTSLNHWSTLSIEPGSAAVPGRRSTAELAHAQLESLWREIGAGVEQVVFVVPGSFDADALGILLGLAEECGIPAGAIVDAAAAACTQPWPERQLLYVDAELGRVLVTPMAQGEKAVAENPLTLDSMGLAGLRDAFARRIAELFVLGTRFDPFHRADTEQKLYDGLADVLAAVDAEGQASFVIGREGGGAGEETLSIEIERSQLLGAVQGFYRAVRQLIAQTRQAQSGLVVQLSNRLAGLPGFEEELARLDAATILACERGHAARAALAAADALALDEPEVKFFRRLPWREAAAESAPAAPAAAPARPAADSEPAPTHVVYRGVAYRVNGQGVVVGRSRLENRKAIVIEARVEGVSRSHCEISLVDGELKLRDLSSFGTFVNERRIEGEEVLKAADVIRVGSPGAELTVVRVEDGDGA